MIKKSLLQLVLLLLLLLVSSVSCTIQKRTFNRGFHVEWKSSKKSIDQSNSEVASIKHLTISKRLNDSLTIPNETSTAAENQNDNVLQSVETKPNTFVALKRSIKHDDTTEMYTYTYKKKTIIASKEDIQKAEKKRALKKSFLLIGLLLLIAAIVCAYFGLSSLESGILILAFICVLVSIFLLISGLFIANSLYELFKSMLIKHNKLLKNSKTESSLNSEESMETYPTIEPNPKSKRNGLIFLTLFLSSIIGFIVFKNFN